MSETTQIPEIVEDKDSENVCMKCRCKQCGKNTEFSSAKRKVAVLTAICCILCVLTISACCCSLYLFTRFQGFRQELVALVRAQTVNADADDAFEDHFPMDHNALPMYGEDLESDEDNVKDNNLTRHRRKKEKGNAEKQVDGNKKKGGKGGGKCKKKELDKMCKCCTDSVDSKLAELEKKLKEVTANTQATTSSTTAGSTSPQQQFAYVAAAHYTTYVDEQYILKIFGPPPQSFDNLKVKPELQKYMSDWQGTLYRNRSFITTASPQTLKVFQESSWMKEQSSLKLFDYDDKSGKFKALHTGLYHLYAHAQFMISRERGIALIHREPGGFKILNSFECGKWTKTEGLYGVGKPCTVGGVVLVKERETVEVVLVDEGHPIGVDADNEELYFGAFLIRT